MSLDWRVQNYLETLMEQFMEEGLSEKEAKEMTPKYFSENRKDADGMVFYEECDWKKATVIEQ